MLSDTSLGAKRSFPVIPETPAIFPEWKRLVTLHRVSGLQVHDARIVAAMNVHRVKHILTFDAGDFKRYPGIQVFHPERILSGSL